MADHIKLHCLAGAIMAHDMDLGQELLATAEDEERHADVVQRIEKHEKVPRGLAAQLRRHVDGVAKARKERK